MLTQIYMDALDLTLLAYVNELPATTLLVRRNVDHIIVFCVDKLKLALVKETLLEPALN